MAAIRLKGNSRIDDFDNLDFVCYEDYMSLTGLTSIQFNLEVLDVIFFDAEYFQVE